MIDTHEYMSSPSFDRLIPYKNDIEALFADYGETLIPRLVEYEVELSCFPVEVLNEIRAIYAHLYRASVCTKKDDIIGNIEKAKSHSKRATLDCYKYLCVAYDDRYHSFFKKYNYVNWHKSKLSNDVDRINGIRLDAVTFLRRAKELESKEDKSKETDYNKQYEDAYKKYVELNKAVNEFEREISQNYDKVVSRSPGLPFLIGAGIGIIIGILPFLLF